jgi:hypothetical protein
LTTPTPAIEFEDEDDFLYLVPGSLFAPVVGDFAQKLTEIAEWPCRKQKKIWASFEITPPHCFRASQSPEDEHEDEARMNIDNYFFKFSDKRLKKTREKTCSFFRGKCNLPFLMILTGGLQVGARSECAGLVFFMFEQYRLTFERPST